MAYFELPSQAGVPDAEKIGKYLTAQLGSNFKFDHQDDELAQAFGGRRGALGRSLNESIFGYMTLVVSNNPLFGAAIRFRQRDSSTLLVVQGIIPNATLRKKVLPVLGMVVGFGALIGIDHWIAIAIFLGWLPLYFLIPRLCAMSLTGKVGRLLADADGCRAAGIDPPPVNELSRLTPAQAGRFRAFDLARIVLGLVIVVGATILAMTERAVLTRVVCRKLAESGGGFGARRPGVALSFLLRWIIENLPESFQFRAAAGNLCKREPRPSDGIDRMVVPEGCQDLLLEIRDGAQVGDALSMLLTADNPIQATGDEAVIRERLAAYWGSHGAAVKALSPIECWSGFSTS